MAVLRLVRRRHHRAHEHHIHQRQQFTGGKFKLFTQSKARRIGLQHPQRDLQRLAVGMLHGRCIGGLAWPGDNIETALIERVERIMNRHRRRHGI